MFLDCSRALRIHGEREKKHRGKNIERHAFWGLPFLDGFSRCHYLSRLIDHALRRIRTTPHGTMAIDGLLHGSDHRTGNRRDSAPTLRIWRPRLLRSRTRSAFSGYSLPKGLAVQELEVDRAPSALYRERSSGDD